MGGDNDLKKTIHRLHRLHRFLVYKAFVLEGGGTEVKEKAIAAPIIS
jgi:hypothetical protein